MKEPRSHGDDILSSRITTDITALALTYKDFLDVGLDALWKKLGSLVLLLKLLPALQLEAYVCANVHILLYNLISSLGP